MVNMEQPATTDTDPGTDLDLNNDETKIQRPDKAVYKTVCLYTAFLSLGLTATLLGPSLLDIVHVLQVDIKSFGFVFTGQWLGYLAGALICGFLYDRLNPELLFVSAMCIMGGATICLPWLTMLIPFVALSCLQHIGMGFLDAGGQAYLVALWTGTKYLEPIMQAAHMAWSIGSAVCPLIVQQFLMPKVNNEVTEVNNVTTHTPLMDDIYYGLINNQTLMMQSTPTSLINIVNTSPIHELSNNATSFLNNVTNTTAINQPDAKTMVQFAYMIVSFVCLVAAIMYVIAFVLRPASICRAKKESVEKDKGNLVKTTKDCRKFRYGLLFILFWFYFMYACVETVLGAFIATFVVEGLKWEKYKGSLITTVMWASMGVGRLLGVPISVCCTPRQMAYTDTVLTSVGIGIMLLAAYTSNALMWVGASVVGLGMGSTFASVVLWAESYINFDGQAGAVFLVGSSTGGMSGPPLVGFLFQTVSHMWLIYFTLGSSLVNCLVFLTADIVASSFKRRLDKQNDDNVNNAELGAEMNLL